MKNPHDRGMGFARLFDSLYVAIIEVDNMYFKSKDFLEAIGPSASLIFASWIFLSFLQTRYTAAYERYRSLIDERRQNLTQKPDEGVTDEDRHQRSLGGQIGLYRRRCEHMRLATNIGVIAAMLLIITI